jgi:hypothetical protein
MVLFTAPACFLKGIAGSLGKVAAAALALLVRSSVGKSAYGANLVHLFLMHTAFPLLSCPVKSDIRAMVLYFIAFSVMRRAAFGTHNYIVISSKALAANGTYLSDIIHF